MCEKNQTNQNHTTPDTWGALVPESRFLENAQKTKTCVKINEHVPQTLEETAAAEEQTKMDSYLEKEISQ
jgi:hypothetical protein